MDTHHDGQLPRPKFKSLVVQRVNNLPTKHDTQVQSLGQEDSLEKGMVTHSSILAWRIPWTEEAGGLQSMESQKGWTQSTTNSFFSGSNPDLAI